MSAEVEVAYAKPDEQVVIKVVSVPNMTVQEAIEQSNILERFPEINLAVNKVGIFGKGVKLDSLPVAGDRIEIYRPLIVDPKEARRRRVGVVTTK